MAKVVIVAVQAQRRLYEIQGYQAGQGNPKKGIRTVQKLGKQMAKLSAHPELGAVEEELSSDLLQFRSFVALKDYRVFYVIQEKLVVVIEIFDVRQDPSRLKLG
jgi:plasmid stabilization system protein ParE